MNILKVLKPGALMTLQDLGRQGVQKYGLTTGGVMDEYASRWANALLGNPADAAVLELTMGNARFEVLQECQVAICGAEQACKVNGKQRLNWQTHTLQTGDQLDFGWAQSGMRAYLAVRGGFALAKEFGSVSTVVRESVGGLNGSAIQSGDLLAIGSEPTSTSVYKGQRMVPWYLQSDYEAAVTLRVIQGYQIAAFKQETLDTFYSSDYKVKPESDRMGFRLQGPAISSELEGIYSEGISFGAIQVPADGQPIVLQRDRQTLGGYPKLGAVLACDCFKLSQMRPGQSVRFQPISLTEGQQIMRDFYALFSALH